ncbi:MAG: D-glycero-beta-D-manno-heptose 1,7-bisphosphate 7-phosphatase [Magnetococcales bacterium]|nr:D-glycero-beta-D-manno-heptose 1,7-bisphosphate 7-phosphatase [Magnetococcales bacterium]MBF0439291.1 D-glycero-beta-D-manno-heptose 1,7-bisphosphate 7-phosphatase [Magnetococcales bacterium]
MTTTKKFLLLDRDGVCNRDRSDYVRLPEELEILPGIPASLGRLHRAGYRVIIITNQAGVGKGLIRPTDLEAIHQSLKSQVAMAGGHIDGIYFCPHLTEAQCSCRKPKPGLILAAQKEWGFNPKETWMVGDAVRDVQAARAAGCRPALVRTGHGLESIQQLPDVLAFDDLADFTDFLLQENTRRTKFLP